MRTAYDADLPMIEAAPGMTLSEVAAASTVPFRVPAPDEIPCLAQRDAPHRFTLRDPARGFTGPAGRFSVLEGHLEAARALRRRLSLEASFVLGAGTRMTLRGITIESSGVIDLRGRAHQAEQLAGGAAGG